MFSVFLDHHSGVFYLVITTNHINNDILDIDAIYDMIQITHYFNLNQKCFLTFCLPSLNKLGVAFEMVGKTI